MIFMILIMLYDFLQVLLSKMKYPTKDDYFSTHILFTIIYLLQKQKLNHNNYYELKINIIYFIQAKEYDMLLHAKIPCMDMHVFL
jgi:hypothetical protein